MNEEQNKSLHLEKRIQSTKINCCKSLLCLQVN